MKIQFLVICISIALSLSGCSVNRRVNNLMEGAKTDSDKVSLMLQETSTARPVVQFHEEQQWVNPVPIKPVTAALPPEVMHCHIIYKSAKPQTIYQFSQDVTQQCGIRVKISPDAAAMLSRGASGSGGSGHTQQMDKVPAPLPSVDSNGMMPLQAMGSSMGRPPSPSTPASNTITDVAYSGHVSHLLDLVTARLGISWRYERGAITLFYLETQRFTIDPTNAKYWIKNNQKSGLSTQSGSSSGSSGAGMSGNSGSSTSQQTEMANDLYGDIQKTAESMLTPGVGRVTMNQTSGVVVVTDVPEVVRSIGDYLRDENTKLSKQVLLKVVVYTVHTDISDKLGIDWDIVFQSLSGKYGIHLANAFNAGSGLSQGGFEILQTATGRASQFAGSKFLLQALSEQVNVSDVKTLSIMTTNLATAGMQIGKQTTYLRKTSVTTGNAATGSEPVQSLEPGEITTGTSIHIMPKILADNEKMMLTMMMDISSLNKLRKIENKNKTESIEAPDTDSRSIPQRVWLKPGDTVIMSGFEQNVQDGSKQGVGSLGNFLFGGGMSGKSKKESFVITITPLLR
ncbi:PilN family type IVB pilus formation outer membrane protein [Candidatus Regiella endosymbiont of Tuberolachnus salignus]|uniref:PilN family type IVB pilus formation outer membrane protein n=1 Tax=Candidatus Regiella endosymbiont of Tuberolachnus salignus TaxID=3077956 RepID=UPI0030D1A2BF